ncbi:NfeD family protein [Clostridium rhizosphaerae]|nr:NfeD family protein [Clostridium rhizosphaerae]
MTPLLLWVVISVAALVVDIATSAFLFLWFTVGGIAAIIALIFGAGTAVQIIVFVAVSAVSMGIGYPFVRRTLKGSVAKTPTMEESYIGREITIDEDIIETAKVKIDGIYWTIKNSGEPIKKEDIVKITGIDGNKLVVAKNKNEEVREEIK